jgi:hypothetical protein
MVHSAQQSGERVLKEIAAELFDEQEHRGRPILVDAVEQARSTRAQLSPLCDMSHCWSP